jgi:parallel beta-helix repeat protein
VGIQTDHSTISDNSVFQNHGDGISCSGGCTISGNTVSDNGDLTDPDEDDGISCPAGCLVSGNSVSGNRGIGLRLGAGSGYRENVITENATKPVEPGVNLQDNFCAGPGTLAASCP